MGHREASLSSSFYDCDISDKESLKKVLEIHPTDTIIHLAGSSFISESVINPHKYFENNVSKTIKLLDTVKEMGIKNFIYSSSAAVYGKAEYLPIDEGHSTKPRSPYGLTKLFVEDMLNTYEVSYGIKHVHLRYFNAAGASMSGLLGEKHIPETHIIPLLIQTALGHRKSFLLYGDDYDTKDGTSIRDYIHVDDIALAHVQAVKYLRDGKESNIFNLGSFNGFSVKTVIKEVERITGKKIEIEVKERRKGDQEILIASSKRIQDLGWKPKYSLQDIIESAFNWYKKQAL